ncbi:dihydrofolate reductase family protein [Micromonospora soli]|uniref:dihydrofolate reductase family protein n=1 Tax=Micromonospora sp. NBRC 110009 TaxID=3061627 RepID=UPI00267371B4|nr:dihydrofolate reductase family protein [Micromonospora sp. NBRC 110009]WKT96740.1 dihydrofolate reductase family protein [Micromonospora sp. NBRC 110009]
MGKIIYWVHQSIDGFIEGPNGEFDWPVMGEELSAYSIGLTERAGAFAYGRRVWEMMSWYWPRAESMSDHPHNLAFAPIWRRTPKVVVSRTLTGADWDARVVGGGDLAKEVAEVREQIDGDLLLTGGTGAAAALSALGLIDEYQMVVHPVLLGGGKRVLPDTDRLDLRLAESRAFDGRSVLLRYVRA